jgi:hypothetical protein
MHSGGRLKHSGDCGTHWSFVLHKLFIPRAFAPRAHLQHTSRKVDSRDNEDDVEYLANGIQLDVAWRYSRERAVV